MILFVIENDLARFEINLESLRQTGLKINARMLASARKVFPSGSPPPK